MSSRSPRSAAARRHRAAAPYGVRVARRRGRHRVRAHRRSPASRWSCARARRPRGCSSASSSRCGVRRDGARRSGGSSTRPARGRRRRTGRHCSSRSSSARSPTSIAALISAAATAKRPARPAQAGTQARLIPLPGRGAGRKRGYRSCQIKNSEDPDRSPSPRLRRGAKTGLPSCPRSKTRTIRTDRHSIAWTRDSRAAQRGARAGRRPRPALHESDSSACVNAADTVAGDGSITARWPWSLQRERDVLMLAPDPADPP